MKEFHKLSERQRRILRYINVYNSTHGYPPTIREIGEATDTNSTSVVNYNLNKLVDEGYLEREQRVSRGVRLIARLPDSANHGVFQPVRKAQITSVQVPLIGRIVAGEPMPVPEDIGHSIDEEDMLDVTDMMLRGVDAEQCFALTVKGDSMKDAMIREGDIVLFRSANTADNGDMVAVWLDERGETTLKYFYREEGRIRLQPANEDMGPIYVNPADCYIKGKVLSVIRQVK